MKSIIQKFSTSSDSSALEGGQGNVIKSGNLVLKFVHEPEKYKWYSEIFQAYSFSKIKFSKPVRSLSGFFIEDGYGATQFLNGEFIRGRMREKIQASKILSGVLKGIPKPKEFDSWVSPWTKAQELAWGESEIPGDFNAEAIRLLSPLFCWRNNIELPVQLIHTDLSGNILFDGNDPVIIDFTPGYFPKEYAEALLVSDSIAWFDEPVEILELLPSNDEITFQLLLRASLFRICVPLFFDPDNYEGFKKEYNSFKNVIDIISKRYTTR